MKKLNQGSACPSSFEGLAQNSNSDSERASSTRYSAPPLLSISSLSSLLGLKHVHTRQAHPVTASLLSRVALLAPAANLASPSRTLAHDPQDQRTRPALPRRPPAVALLLPLPTLLPPNGRTQPGLAQRGRDGRHYPARLECLLGRQEAQGERRSGGRGYVVWRRSRTNRRAQRDTHVEQGLAKGALSRFFLLRPFAS